MDQNSFDQKALFLKIWEKEAPATRKVFVPGKQHGDVRVAMRGPPLEVVVGRGEGDPADDHGVTQPPAKGTTWPMKKSASSEARYTARRADSSLRASRPAGMFLTMRESFSGSSDS